MSKESEITCVNTITLNLIKTWKKSDGQVEITSTKLQFKQPGKYRSVDSDGTLVIKDEERGRTLIVQPDQKEAVLHDDDKKYRGKFNLVTFVLEYETLECEDLGEQELEGRMVHGYRYLYDNVNRLKKTWWLDIQSNLPVMMMRERSDHNPMDPETNGDYTDIMRDIVFNAELDDTLFEMTVPKGCKLQVKRNRWVLSKEPKEEDLLLALRLYAEDHDGLFPPEFLREVILDSGKMLPSLPEEKQARLAMIADGFEFVKILYWSKIDWHYGGQGVRLGQAEKIIFWYGHPETEICRVIFGDLSMREMSRKDLPSLGS